MKTFRFVTLVLVFFLAGSSFTRAWDPYGHMLVSGIAYELLDPKAKAAVDELAKQVPFPGTVYTPVTAGCWMDDLRENNPDNPYAGQYKPWHYITWGLEDGDASPPLDGDKNDTDVIKGGNVVQALKRSLAVLQGGEDPAIPNKAVAFALLSHLVGDVHQPLHCASHFFKDEEGKIVNDAGGNRVTIDNSPEVTLPSGKTSRSNLHSFWDDAYRAVYDPQNKMLVVDEKLKDYTRKDMEALEILRRGLEVKAPDPSVSLEPDFEAWGRESNAIAASFAYPKLARFKKNRYADVDAAYVEGARDIARKRLVLAGQRLAFLLNKTLGEGAKP